MIDNYDSFTYNLYHYVGRYYNHIEVYRNDKISVAEIEAKGPKAIIISPGPKTPTEAGISCEVIEKLHSKFPIFGVCLGHQSIGQVFGGDVIRAPEIMHGKLSAIKHDDGGVFKDLPNPIDVVRYHSLIIKKESLPDCLQVTSETDTGIIMGVRHKEYPLLEGVQFHPESIKTDNGYSMVKNYLEKAGVI